MGCDEIRDDLQVFVAERLGEPDGVLIIDDTGFIKKGIFVSRVGAEAAWPAVPRADSCFTFPGLRLLIGDGLQWGDAGQSS